MRSLEEKAFLDEGFFFSNEPNITTQFADFKHGHTNQPSTNNREITHIGIGVMKIKLRLEKQPDW